MVWDSIADASDSDSMNNQAAVYINDEKDAREPRNLSIPIPVIPLIPWRHHRDLALGARTNRVFSDLLLVMGTTLDPTVFPTIADKPRHQKYHFDNETSEATTQEINGQQKQFLTVIKSGKATFTHIDVHFTRGGEKSYASLERAAKTKRKEYEAAHSYFLKLVKKLRSADEPRSEEAEVLCQIERLLHSLRFSPYRGIKAQRGHFWGKL